MSSLVRAARGFRVRPRRPVLSGGGLCAAFFLHDIEGRPVRRRDLEGTLAERYDLTGVKGRD